MDSLLGSGDEILFEDVSRSVAGRSSAEVDFSDVFGGPPRTSSAYERQNSRSRSTDASISLGGSDRFERGEEAAKHQWRFSTSSAENPGSDGAGTLGRRRDSRSLESASSADPSPVIILDQQRNANANARRSGRPRNEPRGPGRPSIYKIPLSNGPNEHQNLYVRDDPGVLSTSGRDFHFSIYKWPRTELSLVMPYHLKKKFNSSRRISGASSRYIQPGDSDGRNDVQIKEKHRKGDVERGVQSRERKSFRYQHPGKQKDGGFAVDVGCETINVKEFVKLFNSPKVEKQPQKTRTRSKVKEQQKVDEMKDKAVRERLSAPNAADRRPRKAVEIVSDENISSMKKNSTSEGAAGTSFRKTEAFYVKDLGASHSEASVTDSYRERIQMQRSEWSEREEGNIRSLLSILQHVLWPKSDWKPVPLVSIIERAVVRKAYQKAMLCLHPDKTGQKGIEMHRRYIVQVFDILQDARTHFNSHGSL